MIITTVVIIIVTALLIAVNADIVFIMSHALFHIYQLYQLV